MHTPPFDDRPLRRAGWLLGIALGGFFDGILLHQVLQWHHLLSAVDDPRVQPMRVQLMADGLFHLAMYGLLAMGLWQLARARGAAAGSPSTAGVRSRSDGFGARLLLGFGAWHVADIVLNHWLLVLHRTRMGVDNPLAWDLAWLFVFGLLPLALGALWLRRQRSGGRHADAVVGALAALVLGAGLGAAWPARDATATVLFAPDAAAALRWAEQADARLVTALDAEGRAWVVRAAPGAASVAQSPVWPLRRDQGLWVMRGQAWAAGCVAFMR
jgi:uncharacterized membrane protein